MPSGAPPPATASVSDSPRHLWPFDVALGALLLVESLLPLARFHLRLGVIDLVLLLSVVLAGGAMLRGGHALLSTWAARRGGPWLARAPGIAVVAIVGAFGMWHGPPHYSLVTALVGSVLFVGLTTWFASPGRALWRRIVGGLASLALLVFVVLAIDINVLSLFPRHVSVLSAIVASAWLAATLGMAPPLPARTARRMLTLGTAVAGLGLVLAPAASSRVAGYLRRQSEIGTLLSPVSWARALTPST